MLSGRVVAELGLTPGVSDPQCGALAPSDWDFSERTEDGPVNCFWRRPECLRGPGLAGTAHPLPSEGAMEGLLYRGYIQWLAPALKIPQSHPYRVAPVC